MLVWMTFSQDCKSNHDIMLCHKSLFDWRHVTQKPSQCVSATGSIGHIADKCHDSQPSMVSTCWGLNYHHGLYVQFVIYRAFGAGGPVTHEMVIHT